MQDGSICLHCGRSQTPPRDASHRSLEEEIDFINRESERLDDHIRQLYNQKARLRRRLNDIQSTTRILPSETLSIIFLHGCSLHQRRIGIGPLIRFGAICSLWRQVAWSTPALWSTIETDIRTKTAGSNLAILDLCLRNAGMMPLSLDLRFDEEDLLSWGTTPKVVQLIVELVSKRENAEKLRFLRLQDPPVDWIRLLWANGGLDNLRVFALDGTTSVTDLDQGFTLPNMPRVHRLVLSNMWYHVIIPSAQTITTLELSMMSTEISVGIFIQCHNLVECHYSSDNQTQSDNDTSLDLPSPITFAHLTSLTWHFSAKEANFSLFRHLHLPVLQRLRLACLYIGPIPPEPFELLQSFFSRLPVSLSTLELDSWSCSRDDTHRLLPQLPGSIKTLSLHDCFGSFISHLLHELTPEQDERKNFPLLERLFISNALPRACLSLVTGMLYKRGDGVDAQFELEIPRPRFRPIEGRPDVVGGLEALARDRQIKLKYFELSPKSK
ncbi:hypothetical protein P691DRAFT_808586 [Macrolepiota fuliginosa MF-IS2]|uniref:F-box domain-containing protein n=1 Tax=Macrolepiota fuliginosa MF-IS2 TaxID=1400762 RepID=A0A9P5XP98_9AGAR|nr:hypothetical protein P691DRAFT_808586 [Macrolepiota fuliginosa MF-IS2]